MKKIILDVDTGSDDAVAIMTAIKSPDIDLLGITVSHGNLPVEYTLKNTLKVVSFAQSNTPVFKGAAESIVKHLSPSRSYQRSAVKISSEIDGEEVAIHERDINLPKTDLKENEENAVLWMIDTLKNSKDKITIVGVAPPTNIALALSVAPEIKENIEEIVLMGGGVNLGNITATAEFNFYLDPEAVKIILDSGCKVRIVTLNSTHSVDLDKQFADKIAKNGPIGEFISNMIIQRIDACINLGLSNSGTTALHDVLAVLAVKDEEILTQLVNFDTDMDISGGIADGQLIVDFRNDTSCGNVHVAIKADREKFENSLYELSKM